MDLSCITDGKAKFYFASGNLKKQSEYLLIFLKEIRNTDTRSGTRNTGNSGLRTQTGEFQLQNVGQITHRTIKAVILYRVHTQGSMMKSKKV